VVQVFEGTSGIDVKKVCVDTSGQLLLAKVNHAIDQSGIHWLESEIGSIGRHARPHL
jgi:hypothetical protein